MRMIDIIEKKKHGLELIADEIEYFVSGYTNGSIPDYQASALAMAICFNSMTDTETANLTFNMARSGDMLDLREFGDVTVDKHSSGGVGDKTTLIVAPIAAAAGCTVAKMSGRGLGFTGGTIDKLESIPGFCTAMPGEEFKKRAKEHGIVIAGQTGNMAPCDKKLYALRDVTATVDCTALIASSIMSKKLAAGAKNIVLDVKCGSGAFMTDMDSARKLARTMVNIGKKCSRRVSAFITDMNIPLGNAVGNSLEVIEAVNILKGEKVDDLRELCLTLAAEMISLAKKTDSACAYKTACDILDSGKAYDKFREMVISQGGDVTYIDNTSRFTKGSCQQVIRAQSDGYIEHIDALTLGRVSVLLGAGRSVKEDGIDPAAGIILNVKPGNRVNNGDAVMTLYAASEQKIQLATKEALSSFRISREDPCIKRNVIKEHIV